MAIELGHYLVENGSTTLLLAEQQVKAPLTHDEELNYLLLLLRI